MDIGGFEFTCKELNGCRLIESLYPDDIDVTKLSVIITAYYELWDEDVPTVSLVDLSRVKGFTDELRSILASVIRRTVLQPSFIGAAWFCGDNKAMFDEIVRVRREAGRAGDDVFATRDEAIAYLDDVIVTWRDRRSTSSLSAES